MDFDNILALASGHWPFIAVAILLAIIGEVFKGIILGTKNEPKTGKLQNLYKKTMPLHPIITGALLGFVLSATIPDVVLTGGVVSSILYFALSGALSSTIYNLLKGLFPQVVQIIRAKIAAQAGSKPKPDSDSEDGI